MGLGEEATTMSKQLHFIVSLQPALAFDAYSICNSGLNDSSYHVNLVPSQLLVALDWKQFVYTLLSSYTRLTPP